MPVSIVIPTLNERDNIALLVTSIIALRFSDGTVPRVIIVDDNSVDGTGTIADELSLQYPNSVFPIHRITERGRASAGIAGFRRCLEDADCTHIVEMDADFSHHPDDLAKLFARSSDADVVIGSRYIPGAQAINCRLVNRLLSRLINRVNAALFQLGVHDSSGGYKLYARKVLETIDLSNFVSSEYSVGVETLLRCKRNGFRFVEEPITFRNREKGKSKLTWRVAVNYPQTLLKLKRQDLMGKIK